MNKICKTCRWGKDWADIKNCYYNPPVVIYDEEGGVISERPIVIDLDFCSKWASKEGQ